MSKGRVQSVGLLVDDGILQEWQRRSLERMVAGSDTTIDLIVVNSNSARDDRSLSRSDLSAWNVYRAFQRRLTPDLPFRARVPIRQVPFLADATCIEAEPIPRSGLGTELPEEAIDELGSVDVAVRFGFGILVGDALTAPEHGVLSFHHGDLRAYRGRPAGFWEFVNGEETGGVTVQRLSETLDGGEVVAFVCVDIADARSWPDVQRRLFAASDSLLSEAISNLSDPSWSPKGYDRLGELYRSPGPVGLGKYFVRWALAHLRHHATSTQQ